LVGEDVSRNPAVLTFLTLLLGVISGPRAVALSAAADTALCANMSETAYP
jgi:hypothetical protein